MLTAPGDHSIAAPVIAKLGHLTEYGPSASFMLPPGLWRGRGITWRINIKVDPATGYVLLNGTQRPATVPPVGHDEDILHILLPGQRGDFPAIFPGTGRRKQMNRLGRHTARLREPGSGLRVRCWCPRWHDIAGMPEFGCQTLLVQGDTVQDTPRIPPTQYDNCVNSPYLRRWREPVTNTGQPAFGSDKRPDRHYKHEADPFDYPLAHGRSGTKSSQRYLQTEPHYFPWNDCETLARRHWQTWVTCPSVITPENGRASDTSPRYSVTGKSPRW